MRARSSEWIAHSPSRFSDHITSSSDVCVSSVRDAPPISADLVVSTTLNDGWETTNHGAFSLRSVLLVFVDLKSARCAARTAVRQ